MKIALCSGAYLFTRTDLKSVTLWINDW